MIAETIRDLIVYLAAMPKFRGKPAESEVHLKLLKDKWTFMGARFEAILSANGGSFMVGTSVTYVDILLAHLLTWYVEECGAEIVAKMPLLVDLQNRVMSLPSVRAFIRSPLYYPLSGEDYMQSVGEVLGRSLK
jgi:glutathione S-transferase